jgi:LacI family transcriptional regulator
MPNSKTILMLSDNSSEDYVARIRAGANRSCNAAGFALESINIHGAGLAYERVVQSGDYCGVILTAPVSDDRPTLSLLEARRLAYVRVAPLLDSDRGNSVGMDEFLAASAITSILTDRGHTRIGIMRGPRSHLVSMRRYNGYANALGAKGLRVDQTLVAQGDFTRESGREQAAQLFAANPTAIFASNDEMAAGIVDAARSVGLAVPEQLSIVGYDDNVVASTLRPRLTTVRQPLEAMGEAAGRLLVETLKGLHRDRQHVTVPFEIVERESVADCRSAVRAT